MEIHLACVEINGTAWYQSVRRFDAALSFSRDADAQNLTGGYGMPDFGLHIGTGGMLPQDALFAAKQKGLREVALLLPFEASNTHANHAAMEKLLNTFALFGDMRVIVGVKLAHVPPQLFAGIVAELRGKGVSLIAADGEGLGNEAETGTNFAAIAAGVDILSGAGLLDAECCRYANEKGVLFAISGNGEKAFANAYVAAMARRFGVGLVFSSDAHSPTEIRSQAEQTLIAKGCLLDDKQMSAMRSLHSFLRFFK